VYEIPTLSHRSPLGLKLIDCFKSSDIDVLYGLTRVVETSSGTPTVSLVEFNPVTGTVIDSLPLISPTTQSTVNHFSHCVSPDLRHLFLMGADAMGEALFKFDIADGHCEFRVPLASLIGSCAVSPRGSEIWVVQSFASTPTLELGYILVLSASTGQVLDSIKTDSIRLDRPGMPLPLRYIVMHPDLNKAYVSCYLSRPALVVFNVDSRELLRTLYADRITPVYHFAIAPGKTSDWR
jgi:hypothetical protein